MDITGVLTLASRYRAIFVMLLDLLVIGIIILLALSIVQKVRDDYKEAQMIENKAQLKNLDYSKVDEARRTSVIRQIIAADGIDPQPNGYMVINDGGSDVYVRNFTLSRLPKKVEFARTFAPLLNFPGCTASIHISPINDREMSRKMDRQLDILESEHYSNEGYSNRQRKLRGEYQETEDWAKAVESGNESFFNVGFVFSLYADSVTELNKVSDEFHSIALGKGMDVASCYAVQSEAYMSNMPFNNIISIKSPIIDGDAIKKFQLDRKSLSAVFNYTEADFSHKDGIPLGRNYFDGKPFIYDQYDPSHDGFLLCIFGKTGSGKSATIKMMVERSVPLGYRYVAIDSQTRKGTSEGEYATLATLMNGANYQFSASGNIRINPFEVSESVVMVKEGIGEGHEIRTLELSDKITQVLNTMWRLVTQGGDINDATLNTYINRILTDGITSCYTDYGIVDGKPDSLYEYADMGNGAVLSSGLVKKKFPTISHLYKKLLVWQRDNREPALEEAYRIIMYRLQDNVAELYYSKNTCRFFTREEFQMLPTDNKGNRIWNGLGKPEDVIEIHGIRPYFDGQSTFEISRECPFTNIDISPLPDSERITVRQVMMDFVNEQFIKKNSESISSADKLIAIFDECHENFDDKFARKTLANVARTARKRNVGMILSTQTVKEYSRYPETEDILKQAATKFICKQDFTDKDHLIKTLGVTESQAYMIVSAIGGNENNEQDRDKHRGEMCVIDGKKVIFIKVDYLKETEALSVETSSAELEKVFKVKAS